MDFNTLIAELQVAEPERRLAAARLIGTLDETEAFDTLALCYPRETEPQVKRMMSWAAKRLEQARSAGYSTRAAIFHHFKIDYEVQQLREQRETELIRQMQYQSEMQLLNERSGKANNVILGAAIGGALFGAQGMMMGAMTGLTPGAEVLSSGLEPRPAIGSSRIMPVRPSTTDIRPLVHRLLHDPDAERRRKVATDLGAVVNNPAALPFLAQAFVHDPSTLVRQAAQRAAKLIYWNLLYWQMEESGEIAAEIRRRAQAGATDGAAPAVTPAPAAQNEAVPLAKPAAAQPAAAPTSEPPLRLNLRRIAEAADRASRQRQP